MKNQTTTKIPLYAKVGWIGCWLLMLVLITLIYRNCAGSIKHSDTERNEIESYYNQGYSDAVNTGVSRSTEIDALKNPLLKKAYVKGFREGLSARGQEPLNKQKEKQQLPNKALQ